MQYLNRIDQVTVFDPGQKFVYLSENKEIHINDVKLDFQPCLSFYQIGDKIFSARDFYIDSNNEFVYPGHLKGLFFSGRYFQTIKKYTSEGRTFLFKDDEEVPLVEIDKNIVSGNIVAFNPSFYLIKDKSKLRRCSIQDESKFVDFDLSDFIEGIPVVFESKILQLNNLVFIYLHTQRWSDYGFRVLDADTGECVFSTNSFGPSFYLHQDKIYAVGRSTQHIKIMNTSSFEVERIDLSGELGEFVFETQCTPFFYENELYVALRPKGEDIYSYWGVIDLETFQLKFKTEMLIDFSKKSTNRNKTFVSQIKANDQLVGVKVPGNTLHIYKKD